MHKQNVASKDSIENVIDGLYPTIETELTALAEMRKAAEEREIQTAELRACNLYFFAFNEELRDFFLRDYGRTLATFVYYGRTYVLDVDYRITVGQPMEPFWLIKDALDGAYTRLNNAELSPQAQLLQFLKLRKERHEHASAQGNCV